MRLFIAEKPELARAIVEALGGGSRKRGYFDCGGDYVTWCFGHMLALLDPEDYDPRYEKWNMADLPIAHIPWRKKPSGDDRSKDQLKIILQLLKEAESVVHAGDPGEEGQLLVDEILEYGHCQLPVMRVLINDSNNKVVRREIAAMRDNREFAGTFAAAEARSVADQLYGYNMTRAYTVAARTLGYSGLLSVGRVQTPILGVAVRRTRAFKSHQKAHYFNLTAQFEAEGFKFPGRYVIAEGDPVDEKGRLVDQAHAQGIADVTRGKPARVVAAKTSPKETPPPLPYNLLKLQVDASRKFGFKPDDVKEITQDLREKHKLITYNRSDSQYLNDEQHECAPAVLAAIAQTAPMFAAAAQRADPAIKSRAFDSTKTTDHHGIVPTEATANFADLSDAEQKIYLLIARAYVAQFFPKYQYDQTDVTVKVEGHDFVARAKITTSSGWRVLYKNDAGNEALEVDEGDLDIDMRSLRADQAAICVDAQASKQETKPLPLFTMATLMNAFTSVAKEIRDERLRKVMIEKDKDKEGEHGGIGTPATRDSIVANLFERGYLIEIGKNVVPTILAEEFYDALPDEAKFPDMTALWHEQQKSIKAGELETLTFLRDLMVYIGRQVENVKAHGIPLKIDIHPCPLCKRALRRIQMKDKAFWGCTGYADGCKYSCEDKAGKPVPREAVTVSSLYKCQACSAGLIARTGKKKPGQKAGRHFWGCSGYPTCTQTYPDVGGKPDYSSKTKVEA